LKMADQHKRYQLYSPHLPGLTDGCLNVHSKVFAVDDDLFSVGSANLSNRSMAFDTECNLVFEARGSDAEKKRIREQIARLRNRLLAEHLGTTLEQVDAAIRDRHSLHDAIAALKTDGRFLQTLEPILTAELDALIPQQAPFDPEKPINPDELVAQFIPEDARKPVPRRFVRWGILALLLALIGVAWRYTPLRDWVNLATLVALARNLESLPFTPVAILLGYMIAGLLVPITLLIAATGIVFGPVVGAVYAIAGSLVSATTSYWLGYWLGRDTVRSLVGKRINRLNKRIAQRGIIAVMIIRILPVAPFTIINVVAGASHLLFRDYLIGTLLGMTPGILLTVTFIHNLTEVIRHPSAGTVAVLALVATLLIGFAALLQRILPNSNNRQIRS
ncbi:MAG: VTT domain-containing protein, partial [Burkholderiaceae bacterium]